MQVCQRSYERHVADATDVDSGRVRSRALLQYSVNLWCTYGGGEESGKARGGREEGGQTQEHVDAYTRVWETASSDMRTKQQTQKVHLCKDEKRAKSLVLLYLPSKFRALKRKREREGGRRAPSVMARERERVRESKRKRATQLAVLRASHAPQLRVCVCAFVDVGVPVWACGRV